VFILIPENDFYATSKDYGKLEQLLKFIFAVEFVNSFSGSPGKVFRHKNVTEDILFIFFKVIYMPQQKEMAVGRSEPHQGTNARCGPKSKETIGRSRTCYAPSIS
jgi:hypothetical protein